MTRGRILNLDSRPTATLVELAAKALQLACQTPTLLA
jgi:hypothetical protein